MSNTKQVLDDLETVISNITSLGFDKVDPTTIEKLEKISSDAGALGMKTGKRLIDNLSSVLKSFKEGKSSVESISLRFTALEFYKKNIVDNQGTENEEIL